MRQIALGQSGRINPVLHTGIAMGNDPTLSPVRAHVHLVQVETALVIDVVRRLAPHVSEMETRVDRDAREAGLDQEGFVFLEIVDAAGVDVRAHTAAGVG